MVFDLLTNLLLSAALGIIASALTFYLKSVKRILLSATFIGSLTLLVVLGILGIDTYPFSNLLVLGSAISGGSLLGRTIWKRKTVLLAILLAMSVLDIASFVIGPNAASPPTTQTPVQPVALLYVNFTILSGDSHFRLGILDLFLLSTAAMFFALRGFTGSRLIIFGVVSLLLPFIYLIIFGGSNGLPLTPFIAAASVVFLLTSRKPVISD